LLGKLKDLNSIYHKSKRLAGGRFIMKKMDFLLSI